MNFDVKTNRIIVDYVLKYNEQSRKLKKPVPKDMWKQISTEINKILEVRDSSKPLDMSSQLRKHFEQCLIFQLKLDGIGLTDDEFFTVAYPYVNILRRIKTVFISNRNAISDIDDETLNKLNLIVKYRLNCYTFNRDIWDAFDIFYRMGVRTLEINVENSLFGLNPEEKKKLLSLSWLERKLDRVKKVTRKKINDLNNFRDLATNVITCEEVSDSSIESDDIAETQPNPDLDKLTEIQVGSTIQENIGSVPGLVECIPQSSVPTFLLEVTISSDNEYTNNEIEASDNLGDNENLNLLIETPVAESLADTLHLQTLNAPFETKVNSTPDKISTKIVNMPRNTNSIDMRAVEGELTSQENLPLSTSINGETRLLQQNARIAHGSSNEIPAETELNIMGSVSYNQITGKTKYQNALVHWAILFDLYENDIK